MMEKKQQQRMESDGVVGEKTVHIHTQGLTLICRRKDQRKQHEE